ncbi:pyruvate dehydrogenase (acetyl-transferring) E1 component subunit alpha [Candidatus Bathyarchaeota archaeon]|nr:pyruvate dehydrogenase (acetyl-transferring) E1 component subunit alpha [Candidatus Bathyarchaeota archaeon]RLI11411.1 MAG: pyruvate dehydrogenase (acetyl-transferring) E1 component subunit alpha [Candidatus Bathyarchaeota archaeon]RLI22544.1 MAG: pyruvate dehydrogenase (acetyl-transferring) E1 component subunit alpha [Candidatus Bathyarchaeota archaeon]HDN05605.1 pyruvate dehydrogenase (acetyl-transferring) E1 component subunit alpha [Candidatus Bathyarchaeota archaeon]
MYRKMFEIRSFEEKVFELYAQNMVPGTIHLYAGEEAVAVGVCSNLRKDDYITSTHRGHGHCIAKGADPKRIMAEILGKKTGYCKGKGGSMHIADFKVGMLGATAVVGAGIPIAMGAGLSIKLRGTDQVVACFFGEGASNQGTFHEGINMAAIWKLPVIFVCENNLYAMGTRQSRVMLIENIADRAASYGIPGVTVDGNDVLAVYEAAREAVERARRGEGPTLIECKTYRHKGHSRVDPAKYRPKEEVEEWLRKDPIKRLREKLLQTNVLAEEEIQRVEEEVSVEIEEAVKFAVESPYPAPEEALEDVYA